VSVFRTTAVIAAFSLFLTACGGTDVNLEQRIQRIEDEKQIRDVMVQYGRFLDEGDFAGYSQLFAREGTWSGTLTGFTTVKGPENIRVTMEKAFADRKYDPEHITTIHVISNISIHVDGDRATGYSKYTVVSRNEKDEPFVRVAGRYEDVFIREDGQWKFLSRMAHRDIP
jgi:3-phenylpropionate/cinnamic acid dioxygenase small subunit